MTQNSQDVAEFLDEEEEAFARKRLSLIAATCFGFILLIIGVTAYNTAAFKETLFAWVLALGTSLLVAMLHFSACNWVFHRYALRVKRCDHQHIFAAIMTMLLVHIVEINIFAITLYVGHSWFDLGQLTNVATQHFASYSYYSATSYTSLGLGDIAPTGSLRLITGIETLTGLIMIAWTGSLMIFAINKDWQRTGL